MALPTLSPHQDDAVHAVKAWYSDVRFQPQTGYAPDFYLAGYAGTGKSTILPTIIDALGIPLDRVAFVAPTGKAAKVMTSKLALFGITQVATTIHRRIYRPKGLRVDVLMADEANLKGQLLIATDKSRWTDSNAPTDAEIADLKQKLKLVERDLEKALDNAEGPKFSVNVDSDIRTCMLIVCDEASMVGEEVADDLRSFGVPILAIGDPGQLPPVSDNPGFTDREPDFFLTEIHRQARDNPILLLATQAREGKMLKVGDYGSGVRVVTRLKDDATYDLGRDAQIIVGTNRNRWKITSRLRKEMGMKSNGPVEGEPLLVCKNSKTMPAFVNGAFMRCLKDAGDLPKGGTMVPLSVEDETGQQYDVMAYQGLLEEHFLLAKNASTADKRKAYYDRLKCQEIDWGWVITAHKAQGSQWDDVVLHDESGVFREDSARWLYTGLTRAAKTLTVVI